MKKRRLLAALILAIPLLGDHGCDDKSAIEACVNPATYTVQTSYADYQKNGLIDFTSSVMDGVLPPPDFPATTVKAGDTSRLVLFQRTGLDDKGAATGPSAAITFKGQDALGYHYEAAYTGDVVKQTAFAQDLDIQTPNEDSCTSSIGSFNGAPVSAQGAFPTGDIVYPAIALVPSSNVGIPFTFNQFANATDSIGPLNFDPALFPSIDLPGTPVFFAETSFGGAGTSLVAPPTAAPGAVVAFSADFCVASTAAPASGTYLAVYMMRSAGGTVTQVGTASPGFGTPAAGDATCKNSPGTTHLAFATAAFNGLTFAGGSSFGIAVLK